MIPLQVNTQAPEKPITRTDGALDVVDVFRTIQGEGPFAGTPAVFVRLAGCNLQCPLCDTDYTSRRKLYSPKELIDRVHECLFSRSSDRYGVSNPLIVITGGEPFRQACGPFVSKVGWHVQFETNGTLYDESMDYFFSRDGFRQVSLVCSPKTREISKRLRPHIKHFKYVLRAGEVDESDGLPTSSLDSGVRPARPICGFGGTIYVQPCDENDPEKNKRNTDAAVESCIKFGYRLCLQTHKLVGLP